MKPQGEPRWITEAMMLAIHARQVERFGGTHGIIDENVMRSSLARPQHLHAYSPRSDIAVYAAAYLVGFARAQGFRDGNKRIALASALVFLHLNGYALHVPPESVYALTMRAASQDAEDEEVAAFIRHHMVPTA